MKTLIIAILLISSSLGIQAKICSSYDIDYRTPVQDSRIARITFKERSRMSSEERYRVGTAFLISDRCLLTAGHIIKKATSKMYLHFNTPKTNPDGYLRLSDPKDIYDFSLVDGKLKPSMRRGNVDWAVLLAKTNSKTKKSPGELYGHFEISEMLPQRSDELELRGFGKEEFRKSHKRQYQQERSRTLQKASGDFIETYKNIELFYNIDSRFGDSGAPVLLNDKVVAIHHTGRCRDNRNRASGYNVVNNPIIQKAIHKCLELEKAQR